MLKITIFEAERIITFVKNLIKNKLSMMKKLLTFAFALFTTFAFAQTFVSTSAENKNVVLEEFTGITCTFCPDGHVIGQGLHDANPNDVFLINIHAGGYANPTGPGTDFRTSFGSAIDGQAGVAGYPAGTVNRHNFPGLEQGAAGATAMGRGNWATAAAQILTEPSPVNVATQASVDLSSGIITVDIEVYFTGTQTVTSNFLNVAIVQNGVLGPQTGAASFNPGAIVPGPWNPTYTHNHMLRHMMTGQWGEEISNIGQGEFFSLQLSWAAPADINDVILDLVNLDVVAFITEGNQEILTGFQSVVSPVFPNQYDANVLGSNLNDVLCGSTTDLEMTFRNFGSVNLTSLDIDYTINGAPGPTYNWTGNMLPAETEILTIPGVSFSPQAVNNVVFTVSNPNGQPDQNSSNNGSTNSFVHFDQNNMVTGGITAGNISIEITTDGYGSETSWEIVDEAGNIVGQGGQGGTYQSNQTYSASVSVNANECYAFNLYDSYGDGMCCAYGTGAEVLVTDNAGTVITALAGQQLSNFNELGEYFSTGSASGPAWECTPFGCTDLGSGNGTYGSEQDCFNAFTNDPSSPCYNASTSVEEVTSKCNVYPNPAQDILNVEGIFVSVEIYDVFGKLALASSNKSEIDISTLANGSYYVNILTENSVIKRKVTVAK